MHHLGNLPWNLALWSTTLAQTALTIVWSVLGIVSFIAYGLLCTLIGYLAPAPPRAAK